MSIDFTPPSYRAASSDLTIAISPLGLVELADEEFEVHGPRLNRYALNWAAYLGHHWGYRRETGEAQMTFNYYRAFTDYMLNFTFSRGVQFTSPPETEAIVPPVLKEVWEIDNDKTTVLWEIGQQGGITGDSFVKVAWDPGYTDPAGNRHPGRVRILPLQSAHCFPEFHPHDRTRLIRFKLKYRFWGTSLEGTRQVFTYTEIMTEDQIEEYINDEMIDSRPNPLGVIPIVHIPNTRVSGSPWGLPDCFDIISLNRTYNEMATDVADIINYHAAPITVMIGAKASNLERGANKLWAGLPKDAQVFNLEGGHQGLDGALEFMDRLKRAMHEMVGIPETALGQAQPISNTSGVALSIQFQPLMNRWQRKVAQYSEGLERINELILRTVAYFRPEMFKYNPETGPPLKEGQLTVLDTNDPISYRSTAHFPQPLPLDKLVILNEIQSMISLGLESREGALRRLGEESPAQKLQEIRKEQKDDAISDGTLTLVKTQIFKAITELTGMIPGPDGSATPVEMMDGNEETGEEGESETPAAERSDVLADEEIRNRLLTEAYGTKESLSKSIDTADPSSGSELP